MVKALYVRAGIATACDYENALAEKSSFNEGAALTTNTHELERRRSFAIIRLLGVGKITRTEKLLLFAGNIHIAGSAN